MSKRDTMWLEYINYTGAISERLVHNWRVNMGRGDNRSWAYPVLSYRRRVGDLAWRLYQLQKKDSAS